MEPAPLRQARALALIGVAGCGKSTMGRLAAQQLGWAFVEGDDLHPAANVRKMQSGIPLEDVDRLGWLDAVAAAVVEHQLAGRSVVFTCSALRRPYRHFLRGAVPCLRMVHLRIDRELARIRVSTRQGHLFPVTLVDSQFAAWEPTDGEPHVLVLDGALAPADLAPSVIAFAGCI